MTGSSENPGWYRRFVELLEPDERIGELLFGLIMVLTFTLGAGIELGDRGESRDLLIAALGCNTAWGIIDAVLYLIARLSERGRVHRLARSIQAAPTGEQALELIGRELDQRLPSIVRRDARLALDTHVLERVRGMKLEPNRLTAEDFWAGLAVFWLVFLTALPAALPFLVIERPAARHAHVERAADRDARVRGMALGQPHRRPSLAHGVPDGGARHCARAGRDPPRRMSLPGGT